MKLEHYLADVATWSKYEWKANLAMKILKKFFNKTYHWCGEYDDLVICDKDDEFEYCRCFKNS